jgi:hypothetical protein
MHADRTLAPATDVQVVGWPGLDYTLRVSGPPSAPVLTVAPVGGSGTSDATETEADDSSGDGSVVMGLTG